MDADLSLSQSFGGLRIANPDNGSPETQLLPVSPISPQTPSSIPLTDSQQPLDQVSPMLTENYDRPGSMLGFDPNSFSTESTSIEKAVTTPETTSAGILQHGESYVERNGSRHSIQLKFQDQQQQVQFPQYSPMHPPPQRQNIPHVRSAAPLLPQQSSRNAHSRESSYRLHKESSQSSISGRPRRASSRGDAAAMQAGVPSREECHTDRSYRSTQLFYGSVSPLPPRRGSRNASGGQNGTGSRTANISGSPYTIEGGPVPSSEEWQERGAANVMRREIDAEGRPVSRFVKKGVKDFHFGRTLGEGSYSTVLSATDRQTGTEYAIKVLDKKHIIKEKKVKYVNIEKDTLNRLTDHPGVVRLYFTFQDERSLYFVLDIATGGELLGVLKKMTTFNVECTRFYGAQILDTIDYMHVKGVIHRDLKPENVLLDDRMHVKITDFGTAKILDTPRTPRAGPNGISTSGSGPLPDSEDNNRASSFVGTAEYVSPELLTDKNACKASDLWAFGCIIYQLLVGRPPFKAGNEYQTFQKIVSLDYSFPAGFPPLAQDLVERLLVLDTQRRLTVEHVKNHEFFDGMKWGRGLWTQKAPRLQCYVPSAAEPIKLNGHIIANGANNGNGSNYLPELTASNGTKSAHMAGIPAGNGLSRTVPRVITDLPPPSSLDIEWSPVLTKNNERILKLGNLLVMSTPLPISLPSKNGGGNGDGSKFSRFFGGNAIKKRQRLVMVTSGARIILAAAGGDEKKTKTEISLSDDGCAWKKMQDPKGLSYWCIDTVG